GCVLIRPFRAGAFACVLLAPVEEGMADAPAAIFPREHRFAEVEYAVGIVAVLLEKRDEGLGVAAQWCRRRRTDDLMTIERSHDQRAFRFREFGQVLLFVLHGTVI